MKFLNEYRNKIEKLELKKIGDGLTRNEQVKLACYKKFLFDFHKSKPTEDIKTKINKVLNNQKKIAANSNFYVQGFEAHKLEALLIAFAEEFNL